MNFSGFTNGSSSTRRDESTEEVDYSDAMLRYVSQMLMEEEDLEHRSCMLHDSMALQATEKYFCDALNKAKTIPSLVMDGYSVNTWISNQGELNSSTIQRPDSLGRPHRGQDLSSSGKVELKRRGRTKVSQYLPVPDDDVLFYNPVGAKEKERVKNHPNGSEEKKHDREDRDSVKDFKSNKLLASSANDSDLDVSDEELVLCSWPSDKSLEKQSSQRRSRGIIITKEVVDLRSLLTQCAQAVANYDKRTANELIKKIKQHSSPSGDATERLAHYLNNALEARLAGTGTTIFTLSDTKRISTIEILKAYQVYITACAFRTMSNIFANKCIKKVCNGATKLHIIDFGILYGFQWPCLIQDLSARPGGPPNLRITGIDYPQPGFKPAERLEDTGRRLAKFCKKYNVPFEYNPIAKKWDTIQIEDLQIHGDEVVAVNCINGLGNVADETVLTSSPRDVVLKLIKRIKPDIFVHLVTSGTHNSPFFVTRFREAVFHFSALFDMFEATVPPHENEGRMNFEKEIYGRDAMNVIACEGTERVQRPETYKQWQVRNVRAGLRQLPLDREILNCVRDKVKKCYHRDFIVDQDGNWMLQGWKGKVIYALSCWKATDNID